MHKESCARQSKASQELEKTIEAMQVEAAMWRGHLGTRDARIKDLVEERSKPADKQRSCWGAGRCVTCGRAPGTVVLQHEDGTHWPLARCDVARRAMSEGHIHPTNFMAVAALMYTFFTLELPTSQYLPDFMFSSRCLARLDAVDAARDAEANAKDEYGCVQMTDGGSGSSRGCLHAKNSQLFVVLWACWNKVTGKPHIKPGALTSVPRDNGQTLAENNIEVFESAGWSWAKHFYGNSGDHTSHSSGLQGERERVSAHGKSRGSAAGRCSNFGCCRHGYHLCFGVGIGAFGGASYLESCLRTMHVRTLRWTRESMRLRGLPLA